MGFDKYSRLNGLSIWRLLLSISVKIADLVRWGGYRSEVLYIHTDSLHALVDGLGSWKSSSSFSFSTNKMGLVFLDLWRASVNQAKYSRSTKVNGLSLSKE